MVQLINMSFIQSTLKCGKCGYEMNVAFGIVGMTIIAQHPEKCSECNSSSLTKISMGRNAKNKKYEKK